GASLSTAVRRPGQGCPRDSSSRRGLAAADDSAWRWSCGAVTFKSAVDDPSRIAKSKAVGALFGLIPKKYQSGEKDVTGGITRTGDEMVRRHSMKLPMFCYRG